MAILGIDEVGRGPWAGPLVVGAVILLDSKKSSAQPIPYPAWTAELADSKKLTEKKRLALAEQIQQEAVATALGWVPAKELDEVGLGPALRLATRRAVEQIQQQKAKFSEIIIDGTVNFLSDTPLASRTTTLKKADALIKEVSAAAIIAKVARDKYMKDLATIFPDYAFERHVGYGTARHRSALAEFGPTPEHRLSFRPVAQLAQQVNVLSPQIQLGTSTSADRRSDTPASADCDSSTSTSLGRHAESVVAEYLSAQGHAILARNHRTKFYEIDLISARADKLFFVEVKYRHDSIHGGGHAAVSVAKQKRMCFAAESFLQYLRQGDSPYAKLQPVLAAAIVSGTDFKIKDFFTLDSSYY